MVLKGILFDLDGTLIDFKIDYTRARKVCCDILSKHGYPSQMLNSDMLILSMLKKATNYFLQVKHLTLDEIDAIRDEVGCAVAEVEKEAAEKATILDGMATVLDFSQANNLKSAVITFNTSENALLSIKSAGLSKYFPDPNVIVGRDRVFHSKPHPDHPRLILNALNLSPDEVCIIGDHPRDIETAVNINARSIAIISPEHTPEEFQTPYYTNLEEVSQKVVAYLEKFISE